MFLKQKVLVKQKQLLSAVNLQVFLLFLKYTPPHSRIQEIGECLYSFECLRHQGKGGSIFRLSRTRTRIIRHHRQTPAWNTFGENFSNANRICLQFRRCRHGNAAILQWWCVGVLSILDIFCQYFDFKTQRYDSWPLSLPEINLKTSLRSNTNMCDVNRHKMWAVYVYSTNGWWKCVQCT